MAKHVVKRSKGKLVVVKKPSPKSKEKLIRNITDNIVTPKADQSPVNNNPVPPQMHAATQPIAVPPRIVNPFSRSAGIRQQNS